MFGQTFKDARVIVYNNIRGSRTFDETISDGTITIREGPYKRIARIKDGVIFENKSFHNSSFTKWIRYGEFEKERSNAQTSKVFRYRNNSMRAKHGISIRKDLDLYGHKGQCITFYSRGRFIWQKFIYQNRITAYYMRWNDQEIKAVYPDKTALFEMKGLVDLKRHTEGLLFFQNNLRWYEHNPFDYSKDGCFEIKIFNQDSSIKLKGQFVNRQRAGHWFINKKNEYYITGIKVTKDFYEKPPEKLNPKQILTTSNAQFRTLLIQRIGIKRLMEKEKPTVIHKEKDMILLSFKANTESKHIRFLKVKCPTTSNDYFLRVPVNINKCEDARQWTFGIQNQEDKLNFIKET